MVPEQELVTQTCTAGLFIPDHCPSSKHFGLYMVGKKSFLDFSRGRKWFSFETGMVQMTRIWLFGVGNFIYFKESREDVTIFGYQNFEKRRAIFYIAQGEEQEPEGLLLMHYWLSEGKDLVKTIKDYYDFPSYAKDNFQRELSLSGFFTLLKTLISEQEIRVKVNFYCQNIVKEAVAELEKRAEQASPCGHCMGDCSCGDQEAEAIRQEAKKLISECKPMKGNNFFQYLEEVCVMIYDTLN